MLRPILDRWPLFAALASAVMLAVAHAFETFGGLAPCTLCYRQRDVYWLTLALGLAAFVAGRLVAPQRVRAAACLLLLLIFLFGAGQAAYHAGVEWHWWPGPQACSGAARGVTAADMASLLNGTRIKGPSCDQAAWVFAGLSMAGRNAVASLSLAGLSLAAVLGGRRRG
jgi:disulfide bond formation protein DsbB